MSDRITEPEWAYRWALIIGDRDVTKPISFQDLTVGGVELEILT